MRNIVLLDTSIFLNILDIPGFNQSKSKIFDEYQIKIENDDKFLLPMATIWETGNHISRLSSGDIRRKHASSFVEAVIKAVDGNAPYQTTHFPDKTQFIKWLQDFPKYAQMNKSVKKINEGVSLSDLSIIKEWEQVKTRSNMSRVLIWSLDSDLIAYDTGVE